MNIDWTDFGQQFEAFVTRPDHDALSESLKANLERARKLKDKLYEDGDIERWSRMSQIVDLLEEASDRTDNLFGF